MHAQEFDPLTRRQFARLAAAAGLAAALAACGGASTAEPTASPEPGPPAGQPTASAPPGQPLASPQPGQPTATEAASPTPSAAQSHLVVARGADSRAITRAALAALGGMEQFVKPGGQVIVKPNICVDYRTYEFGATTNPQVVAALVELCLAAGAARVRVMDTPFAGAAETAYVRSGIADAVKAAGGEMEIMNPAKFREADIPAGRDIRRWSLYQDVLTADLLIDVPVAKHHGLARLSLAGKNLMGIAASPNMLHADLGQRVADLVSRVRPGLVVVDAVRILVDNGPTGGSLGDVKMANTVIAGRDIVAADAYAATLFGLTGSDIAYVRAAADMGLGTLDLKAVKIEEIAV